MNTRVGYYRERKGKGFAYKNERGHLITAPHIKARLAGLAVPPAWSNVWISKDPAAHLLATGYDDRGRKQYIYHPEWQAKREERKFKRLLILADQLPRVRRTVAARLQTDELSRMRVLAAVVSVLDATGARVGHDEYTKSNNSFGITTIRKRHVTGKKTKELHYTGKAGVEQTLQIDDPRTVQVIRECEDTPGYELFKFVDSDGVRHDVTADHVNDYIAELVHPSVTAKDFRTWHGTVVAMTSCINHGKCDLETESKQLKSVFADVAAALGNTPAMARDHYIHPAVPEAFKANSHLKTASASPWLSAEEAVLRTLLKAYK